MIPPAPRSRPAPAAALFRTSSLAWRRAVDAEGVRVDRDAALRPLLHKLRARDVVTEEEERILRDAIGTIRELAPGRVIVRAGVTLSESTLLFDGFVCRYKDLSDGQ